MRRRLSLMTVGGFAAASLFLMRAALAVDVAPPGSGFSAWFPVEPKESSEPTQQGRALLWVATDQAYIFIIGRGDNAKTVASKSDFESALKGFLTEVEGRVLQVMFAGSKLSGAAMIILESGRGSYNVMGAKFNDQTADVIEIDRFMTSFKLTAR